MIVDHSTPVLLLGGGHNSLAVTRNLGRHGVAVSVSGGDDCWAHYSRHCRRRFPVPQGTAARNHWKTLLLSPGSTALHGHIVLACNDDAIEFIVEHREALAHHYVLADFVPKLLLAMLDKMRTLELAREVGVPTPNFWRVDGAADVQRLRDDIVFPVMVKPIHSHKFVRVFGRKLFIIKDSFDELADRIRLAQDHGLEVMVVEMVPGPDDLLSSYYTYIDRSGRHLFHFTKRVLRRHPVNSGPGCYHITEWLPQTAQLGKQFFAGLQFQGMANIEFKRDPRDGKLKVIEVNSRFTAAHELLVGSGAPIDLIIYCHLTGQSVPQFADYEQFRRLWNPLKDFRAFRQLRARGELSFPGWVRSVLHRRMDFPIWSLRDPLPFAASTFAKLRRAKGAAT